MTYDVVETHQATLRSGTTIYVDLEDHGNGRYHYNVRFSDGKHGEIKTIGSMSLDRMRKFALHYAAPYEERDKLEWKQVYP